MTNYPELLEKLRASREDFLAAVRGVTDAQAAVNPSAGGWSILQCVEHVATAETALFQRLSMERIPLPDGSPRNLEAAILGRGADRNRKFDAPELVRPAGRFATLEEAVSAFRDVRVRCIAWEENCDEDLRCCSAAHPFFGPVTGYEMVLFIAMHASRHALQIRELCG